MAETDERPVQETVTAVLSAHPVAAGFLFGSHADGTQTDTSDIDVAVVFDGISSGDPAYNDTFLGLSAELAVALGTDDVDLVDLEQADPTLVRTVFDHGDRLVGSPDTIAELRDRLLDADQPSPLVRLDDALRGIDDSLR